MVMKALDLFCGAGGASMGLHQAGYDVVGVDIDHQPNYPFEFVKADAVEFPLGGFDLVWASPPCQAFTAYKRRPEHVKPAENLIAVIRRRLQDLDVPWVIENVTGARSELIDPIQLCGSRFGLDVRRHRLFEVVPEIEGLPCDHKWQTPRFPPATNRENLRSTVEVGVWRIPLDVQRRAMGIWWMTREELSQAIPPAYARYIAEQIGLT
jgi:DNA (cytosine-5)-methyltransferase 1